MRFINFLKRNYCTPKNQDNYFLYAKNYFDKKKLRRENFFFTKKKISMYNFCEIKKNLERIDKMLNRRTFIKITSLATLGLMFAGCGGNAATSAGRLFTEKFSLRRTTKLSRLSRLRTENLFMSATKTVIKVFRTGLKKN